MRYESLWVAVLLTSSFVVPARSDRHNQQSTQPVIWFTKTR